MAGWFFLFFLLIVVISAGISIGLGYSSRPRPLGWVLVIGGLGAGAFTVDKWARVLPGICGIATLNGLIILISGHALNQPAIQVPRLIGALFTVVMASASFITANFADRRLTTPDRGAYLGVLACFVAMFVCVTTPVAGWELPVCIGFIASIAVLWARSVLSVENHGVHT